MSDLVYDVNFSRMEKKKLKLSLLYARLHKIKLLHKISPQFVTNLISINFGQKVKTYCSPGEQLLVSVRI